MKASILILSLFQFFLSSSAQVLLTEAGLVSFHSDAPLELIEANCSELKAAIRTSDNSFAFSIKAECFTGFNSALQKEHFDEKFMESHLYPSIKFQGKIIEPVSWQVAGEYLVHAKGNFEVHGITQERIIQATLIINKKKKVEIQAEFSVLLKDHNIMIPSVVEQNIAEEIKVQTQIQFDGA